jgi:SAM-dependent methyltransferase
LDRPEGIEIGQPPPREPCRAGRRVEVEVRVTERGLNADQIDTSQPHPARMYDYYLGGRDNYEVDRLAAERIITVLPEIRDAAHQNRAFLRRAVRAVVAEYGIRQIVDIGTGIPTSPNTHEVAQAVAPETSVVYIDNDPIVGVHANARLTGAGRTTFFLGDVRQPSSILARLRHDELVDFGRPVALLLVAVLHFVMDADDPYKIVAELRDALPPGSIMVLSHGTADRVPLDYVQPVTELLDVYKTAAASLRLRRVDQVHGFFDGFELLEPGLTRVAEWRPDPDEPEENAIGIYGGMAYKP